MGSITIKCPWCGKPALCSPSKGIWCSHCENNSIEYVSRTRRRK